MVTDTSWRLYRRFIARAGARPTLIEWDSNIPEYEVLIAEVAKADMILNGTPASEADHALAR